MDKARGSKNKTHSNRGPLQKKPRAKFRPKSAKADNATGTKSSYQMDFKDYTGSMTTERLDHVIHDSALRQSNPRADPPGEPSQPRVSDVTSRSCVLEWSEPEDDGGSPIKQYHIQFRTRGSFGWAAMRGGITTETRHQLKILTPGTVYQFRVAAENAADIGVGGLDSDFVQAAEPPDMPSKPDVIESSRKHCLLSWKPPEFNGGSGITGYHVEYRITRPEKRHWSRVTNGIVLGNQFTVRDVLSVANYYFRIIAVNKIGEGNPGLESDLVETIDPPGFVKTPAVTDMNATSCVLSWNLPDDDGGAEVLGYHVEQCRTDSFGWVRLTAKLATGMTFTVHNLIKSCKYRFRIFAVNKKGEGDIGHESVEIEAIEPPASPTRRPEVYDVTFQSCMISWDPPIENGGSSVTGFRIERKQTCETLWTAVGSTINQLYSIRATGLMDNCLYCFRVRAINKAGVGVPSDTSDVIRTTGQDISDSQSIALIETNQLEGWGMVRVRAAFQRGLHGINLLVESILPLRNSVSFREIQLISSSLRHYSAEAYFNMKDADEKAKILNNELNKRIEALMYEKGQKELEVAQKVNKLAKLRAEKAEKETQLTVLRVELVRVSAEYYNAENRLKAAEKELANKKRERDIVRGVGVGVFAVPIVGWIAGAIMVVVSFTALEENVKAAEGNCSSARNNMNDQHVRVSDKTLEISQCNGEMKQNESERDTLNSQIGDLQSNITDLQAQFKQQSFVSENLRKCVTFISKTANRTEVLNDQVKFLYNPATIVEPLIELAAHLSLPEMDKFGLQTNNLKGMETFVSKLKMIIDADDCWKQDNVLDFKRDHKILMATETGKKQMKSVQAINSVVDNMYTDDSGKEDRQIMLAQHAGWEHFLVPAPTSVSFLGQLMLISTQKDFPLDKHPPTGGFRLLRWPKSFRTTVLQLANTGWDVFNTADNSMDQIRMYANTLPLHLRSGFDILSEASHEEVERCLPLCLMSVKNVAEKCLLKAKSTEDGFMLVMDMVAELQEACVSTKGFYEKQKQHAQISIDVAEEQRKNIEEEKEFLSKQKQQIQESIEEAEKQFDEAIKSLPNGWSLLGMAVVEGIVDTTSAIFSKASKTYQKVKKKLKGSDKQDELIEEIDEPTRKSYKQSIVLHTIVNELNCIFVDEEALNKSEVMYSTKMISCDVQVERIVKNLRKITDCDVKEEVIQLATCTSSLCSRLKEVKENISESEKAELNSLAASISEVGDKVSALAEKGQSLMEACPRQRPPNMKAWQSRDEPDTGAVKSAINKAKVKTEGSCQMLKNAQQNYDKISEDLTDASNRLSEILAEMARLDLDKLEFEQIIDILHRGLVAFGSIREQWGKIVHFFQTIVNTIDCSLNVSLKNFLDISDQAKKSALEGYTLSHLKRDMLYQQVTHVSELAWFVSMVAESYSEVSTKHLMPRMDGLQKLLSFDPKKEKPAIQLKLQSLHRECKDAQGEIATLIEGKKRDFNRLVNKRVASLQSEMKQSIGGVESKQAMSGPKKRKILRESTQQKSVAIDDLLADLI